jgi:hypothetical protein
MVSTYFSMYFLVVILVIPIYKTTVYLVNASVNRPFIIIEWYSYGQGRFWFHIKKWLLSLSVKFSVVKIFFIFRSDKIKFTLNTCILEYHISDDMHEQRLKQLRQKLKSLNDDDWMYPSVEKLLGLSWHEYLNSDLAKGDNSNLMINNS